MNRENKVFQGTPKELEQLLNDGWYIERIISSHIKEGTYYEVEGRKDSVVVLVVHLSKEQDERRK